MIGKVLNKWRSVLMTLQYTWTYVMNIHEAKNKLKSVFSYTK